MVLGVEQREQVCATAALVGNREMPTPLPQLLVESALYGLGIGIGLALLILTVTTCNFVVALVATLCIAGITTCVVAVIAMAGWKLGVSFF